MFRFNYFLQINDTLSVDKSVRIRARGALEGVTAHLFAILA